jgi:hypothetical protein
MSLVQTCVEAEAAIARARSLFGSPSTGGVPNSSAEITDAIQTATTARDRTTEMAGGAGMPAYRASVDRGIPPLATASSSDAALTTQLTSAQAVSAAGASRMEAIAAQTRSITAVAPMAQSASAQQAVITALRNQIAQAQQVVNTTQQQAGSAASQISSLKYPKDAPASGGDGGDSGDGKVTPLDEHDKKGDDDKKKKDGDKDGGDAEGHKGSGSWSKGKGSDTHVEQHGDTEQQWGHPTDPHEWKPDVPQKTGTFDDGKGHWQWKGPGYQTDAEAKQTTDGIGGKAGADGWVAKGGGDWSGNVFGHQLDANASAEAGAHANVDGVLTDHGVSAGGDAFVGIEGGVKGDYHLGPVDLSLGATGQLGAGGSGHFDLGMDENGKFVIGGTLGAAWGLGGKISPHIAIDPKGVSDAVDKAEQWLKDLF